MSDNSNQNNADKVGLAISISGDESIPALREALSRLYVLAENGKLVMGQVAVVDEDDDPELTPLVESDDDSPSRTRASVIPAIGFISEIKDFKWSPDDKGENVFAFIPIALGIKKDSIHNIFIPVLRNLSASETNGMAYAETRLAKMNEVLDPSILLEDSSSSSSPNTSIQ
ncbi:MAG: hypothetical protein QW328_07020 [Nitrososphaerota archaeon]